jgi:formylglycine-generating enzyme required for sulfatase activity
MRLDEALSDMIQIEGGEFRMGSDRHYPEEAPVHRVRVDSFLMDRHLVTNREFARFVIDTGYVTFAERLPQPEDYPGALPEMLYAGSMVFTPPRHPVDTSDWSKWWRYVKGANWKQPYGPSSGRKALRDHPVVHVTFEDAMAYADWLGKELPTEAEWEFAARGGLDGAEFAWGDELTPGGRHMANTWQGQFPNENLLEDGYPRTSPVGAFPANGYGLHDMIGNVWEWTSDWFADRHDAPAPKSCCTPVNPRGGRREDSIANCGDGNSIPRKVLKGGSHLCAPSYCRRYRPAARHPQPIDSSSTHIGFRCIKRL